jgi:hypothetical protein
MPIRVAKALDRAGRAMGSKPWEWWGSYDKVPLDLATAIEIYDGGKWVNAVGTLLVPVDETTHDYPRELAACT